LTQEQPELMQELPDWLKLRVFAASPAPEQWRQEMRQECPG
jgi:hypothetical protein